MGFLRSFSSSILCRFLYLFLRSRVPVRGGPTAVELSAFFTDFANFADLDTEQLFARLGPSHRFDDWDWGRFVHTWQSRELWVRVGIQGNSRINYVIFVHRHKKKPIEELVWQRLDDGRSSIYQELL